MNTECPHGAPNQLLSKNTTREKPPEVVLFCDSGNKQIKFGVLLNVR